MNSYYSDILFVSRSVWLQSKVLKRCESSPSCPEISTGYVFAPPTPSAYHLWFPSGTLACKDKVPVVKPLKRRAARVGTAGSHWSIQSGGVHGSSSVPGSSKYWSRNSCSLAGGTVEFRNPAERLWKDDRTRSAGKDRFGPADGGWCWE